MGGTDTLDPRDGPIITLDDVPWIRPTDQRVTTAAPRRCRHAHRERRPLFDAAGARTAFTYDACLDCGHPFDPGVVRRNRNNGRRGRKIERQRNAEAGIENRGALNRPEDGGGAADPLVTQSKSGGWFPARIAAALDALTLRAGQIGAVVVTETPGRGRKARIVAVVNYADLLRLIDASRTIDDGGPASGTSG